MNSLVGIGVAAVGTLAIPLKALADCANSKPVTFVVSSVVLAIYGPLLANEVAKNMETKSCFWQDILLFDDGLDKPATATGTMLECEVIPLVSRVCQQIMDQMRQNQTICFLQIRSPF